MQSAIERQYNTTPDIDQNNQQLVNNLSTTDKIDRITKRETAQSIRAGLRYLRKVIQDTAIADRIRIEACRAIAMLAIKDKQDMQAPAKSAPATRVKFSNSIIGAPHGSA